MKYGVAALVSLLCLAGLAADPVSAENLRTPVVAIQAEGRGGPWLNLRDGFDLAVEYGQGQPAPEGSQPTAMVADDFDGDGMPDLVTGFAEGTAGLLVIQRGNPGVIFPHLQTGTTAPFFPSAIVVETPGVPDFIVAGDFDNDGHPDVVTAARGAATLLLHSGDGAGGLKPARSMDLAAEVTLLIAGDVNRVDRLFELVVGTNSPDGSELRVFESPEGAWNAKPDVFSLSGPATAATLGDHDRDTRADIAVAAGSELVLIRGRDRKLSEGEKRMASVPEARVEQSTLGFEARSIAFGDFTGRGIGELAVLSDDGRLELMEGAPAKSITEIETGVLGGKLVAARATTTPSDDLIIIERDARELHVYAGGSPERAFAHPEMRATLSADAKPISVVPMRLNPDALADLVILRNAVDTAVAVAPSAVPTIFTVTNTADSGVGSLRRAINDANFNAGADSIYFAIPGAGVHTIHALSDLPAITDPVTIDGTTQSGYAGIPLVEIHGTVGESYRYGLIISAGNSVVRGLTLNRFSWAGIRLETGGNNFIESNYIGTDVTGGTPLGNLHGIECHGSSLNTIGGRLAGQGNVISGNELLGIYIAPYGGGVPALDLPKAIPDNGLVTSTITISSTELINDLDVWMQIDHPNVSDLDLYLIAPDTTRIALSTGNGGDSANLDLEFDDEAGLSIINALPPLNRHYRPEAALSVLDGKSIAGTWTLEVRDTIVSNVGSVNNWGLNYAHDPAVNNMVEGNRIGTDPGGTFAVPNPNGIRCYRGPNFIGAPAAGAGNLISGYNSAAIILTGDGNLVQRNLIGTNADGSIGLGISADPILFREDGNLLGGAAAGAGNVVRLDLGCGITIEEGSANQIQGNHIGLDVLGLTSFGGAGTGVCIEGGAENSIGGSTIEARNLISGLDAGIRIAESPWTGWTRPLPYGNTVIGNYIGTDVLGRGQLGHATHGIAIEAGYDNYVDGDNVICANGESGVWIGLGASSNHVIQNRIGVDVDGAPDAGNGHGVIIEGRHNVIRDNVISGNQGPGVLAVRPETPVVDAIASTILPMAIPDLGGVGAGMEYVEDAMVIDVDVQIDVNHTYDSDLVIDLFAPDGTQVRLTTNNGGDGDGYDGTIFDDEAILHITEGTAPFIGSYRPEQPLAAFDGVPAQGWWNIAVRDEVAGDIGTLQDASVILTTVATQGNQILLNEIGLDFDAVQYAYVAAPNGGTGVHVEGAGNRLEYNYIAGNLGPGVEITGQASVGNVVMGNTIGFPDAANPDGGIGNRADGVIITANPSGAPLGNRIGVESAGNAIYYNAGNGVRVVEGMSTSIRENDITQNGRLGIDLGPDGVTHNDPLDTDGGANGLQNFPVITAVTVGATETVVEGILESTPEQQFIIDLHSWAPDFSGYGEGLWLTSQPVTTSPTGDVPFVFVVPGNEQFFTVTATGPDGSTSEFSGAFTNIGAANPTSDLRARRLAGTAVEITYSAACGAVDHAIYWGVSPILGSLQFSDVECSIGWNPVTAIDPGDPDPGEFFYFVVVGQNYAHEGSYGQDSFGVERPEASGFGECDRPLVIATACP